MASKEELSEQLAITTKLNTVVQQMATSLHRIEGSYESQVSQVEKLSTTINQLNTERVVGEVTRLTETIEKLIDSMTGVSKSSEQSMQKMVSEANKASRASTTLTGRLKDAATAVGAVGASSSGVKPVEDIIVSADKAVKDFLGNGNKLGKFFSGKLPKQALIATGAVTGFMQGIKNVVAVSSSLAGFFSTFISGVAGITASILSIPLKIFTGLVDMAAKASGGSNELQQAIEDLRKEFGDLAGPTNKTIIDLSHSLKGFSDTGLSAFRVFGMMHERLNMLRELFVALGPTFELIRGELEDNGGALLAYQKGLGVANEEMGNIAIRAKSMGVEMSEVFNSMTKQTLELGEAFGISQKVIGKDMAKAMNDVAHFGSLAVEEIAQASVYARKLGIELDKITGTLEAFETFDSAADNVATLSQAFGVQLDTFKLVEAESPADIVDQLRKSFKAAGHDAKDFNRQQLKLISQMTGLDEATSKAAFSLNNQGLSLDEVKKKSQEAEKKQMSQAEAMSRLADSIERLVKSGSGEQAGGFWDQFVKGLMTGLQHSKEFRTIIWNIKKGLHQVFWEGMKLGRSLPTIIKPLGELFSGLSEFFQPAKFKMLFSGIADALRILGVEGDAGKALTALQTHFENFFAREGGAFNKIVNGAKGLMKMISKIITSAIPIIIENVAKGLNGLAELIKDPSKIGLGDAAGEAQGFAAQLLGPIFKAIIDSWPQLKDAIVNLWTVAWPHIKKGLITVLKAVGPFLASVFFGPIVMKTLLAAGINALGGVLQKIITGAFSPTAGAKSGAEAAKGVASGFGKGFSKFGKFLGPIAIAAGIADVAVNIKDAMDMFEKDLAPEFGKTEAKMGAAGAGIINALTFGLLPKDIQRQIAEGIAGISGELLLAVEDAFGLEFARSLRGAISSGLNVFSSLGQLIKDIFTGDEDKIAESFVDLGWKLLKFVGDAFDWLIEALPTITVHIAKFAFKLYGAIFKVIGKIFKKGKDIPIVGGLLEAIGSVFEGMGEMYSWVGKQLGKLAELFKADGVLGTIGHAFVAIWDGITAGWEFLVQSIADGIAAVVDSFVAVYDFVTSPFRRAWKFVSDIFNPGSGSVTKMFKSLIKTVGSIMMGIVDLITLPHKMAWEFVSKLFTEGPTKAFGAMANIVISKVTLVTDKIKELFPGAWEKVKSVFTGVGSWFTTNVWDPIKKIFVGDGEGGILGTIKKAFTDAYDGIKKTFSWETISGIFNSVVEAIVEALGKLKDIPVFKDMIEIAKKVFEIRSPSKVFQSIGEDVTAGMDAGMKGMPETVGKRMREAQRTAAREGKGLGETVSKASQGGASPEVNTGAAAASAKNLENVSSQLMTLKKKAMLVGANAKAFTDEVRTGALIPALKAAEKMIETANTLNTALADGNLNKLNVQASLRNVAKAAGLGGKANYSIQNKGVNITINMTVKMNAEELEKAMVLRATSIIRDRLRLAGQEPDKKFRPLPDNPDGVVEMPGTYSGD